MAGYLDQHPDIYFAAQKEPFFFSKDLPHARAVTDEQRYLELFADGVDRRYRAEGSTWSLYSKVAAASIKQSCPEARIIIMLRDPIDLIVSQFQYNLLKGNEQIEDIDKAILAEPERLLGRSIPPSNSIAAALHYTAMVDFVPQIERYRACFGEDRIHIILFDDLKKDAGGCVRQVFRFLDLEPDLDIDLALANETSTLPKRRFGGLYRTMRTNRGLMGRAKRLLPKSLKKTVWTAVDGLNRTGRRHTDRPELSAELRTELATRLRPGIDRLAEMLGRDLSHWARPAGDDVNRASAA